MIVEPDRGFSSRIYRVKNGDSVAIPHAEVIRTVTNEDPHSWARKYWGLRIAKEIFPDNFIQPVGTIVQHLIQPQQRRDFETWLPKKVHLYTKAAPVSPDHEVFAEHARPITSDLFKIFKRSDKESYCNCAKCNDHREHHKRNKLEAKAKKLAERMKRFGIVPPYQDLTDYCNNGNQVIFFEVETLDPYQLKNTLKTQPEQTPKIQRILHFLDRFEYHMGEADKASQRAVKLG